MTEFPFIADVVALNEAITGIAENYDKAASDAALMSGSGDVYKIHLENNGLKISVSARAPNEERAKKRAQKYMRGLWMSFQPEYLQKDHKGEWKVYFSALQSDYEGAVDHMKKQTKKGPRK